MASMHWGIDLDANEDAWYELIWIVSQWHCQQRGYNEAGSLDSHIQNPAKDNDPCEWCSDEGYQIVENLRELFQAFGSVAYACGRSGVPEDEAAQRALQAVIERAREIERPKELLAELDPKGWWRLPPEVEPLPDEPHDPPNEWDEPE